MKGKETTDHRHFIDKYVLFKSIIKQFKNKPKEERTAEEHSSVRKSCYQIQKLRSLNPDLRFLVDENLMETNLMEGIIPNVDSFEKILQSLKNEIKKTKKQKQKLKLKTSENSQSFKLMIVNKKRCYKCNDKHTPYLKFCKCVA